jgi:hypothetical protein
MANNGIEEQLLKVTNKKLIYVKDDDVYFKHMQSDEKEDWLE